MSEEFNTHELAALAAGLKTLWHLLVGGVQQSGGLDGLQRQQFWVLGALSTGPRRMSELAACTQTSQASLTGIVDRLLDRGLVERRRDPQDRRVVEVVLTDSGREQMRVAHERMLRQLDEVLAPLDAEERRALAALVARVVADAPHDVAKPRCHG